MGALALLNVHIGVIQIWAWSSMLNDRIPQQGIEQALNSTFNGHSPCDKCHALANLKKEQNKPDSIPLLPDFEDLKPHYLYVKSCKNQWITISNQKNSYLLEPSLPPKGSLKTTPSPPPKIVV